jgi:hypothetical protein
MQFKFQTEYHLYSENSQKTIYSLAFANLFAGAYIRVRAFEDCRFPSTLSEGIETIEAWAFMTNDFRNRDGSYPPPLHKEKEAALVNYVIETLIIPEGVVSIGADAFRNKK